MEYQKGRNLLFSQLSYGSFHPNLGLCWQHQLTIADCGLQCFPPPRLPRLSHLFQGSFEQLVGDPQLLNPRGLGEMFWHGTKDAKKMMKYILNICSHIYIYINKYIYIYILCVSVDIYVHIYLYISLYFPLYRLQIRSAASLLTSIHVYVRLALYI